jgi:hypothetical protein
MKMNRQKPTEPIYLSLEDVEQIVGWGAISQIHANPPKGDLAARLMALRRSLQETESSDCSGTPECECEDCLAYDESSPL